MAVARQRAVRAVAPVSTNVTPMPLIKLDESSNDELYRPTPPRAGDPGQGSSRWYETPPSDDTGNSSDDDDGADYTAFYRHFGM
jgi:hypothetical protein